MKSGAVGEILVRAAGYLQEFQNTVASICPVSAKVKLSRKVTWVPPPVGNFKLNVDAAVKIGLFHMGAGAGRINASKTIDLKVPWVEVDVVNVIAIVNSVNNLRNPSGLIENTGIKALCKYVDVVSCQAISRDRNGMAHTLASVALSSKEDQIWHGVRPLCTASCDY
ncbi:hypothetical protein Ddye_024764 [Dipteronia dyeriana]|uniref:RNase H type-1 domain-containing protein n=1 Tax=Dipteronia dyeriana TaxID=168575 RepID=A0AAD9TVL9_9ROSI|nr:hypothetical protein Ddye_024764 [Dipteronia dyeriana]